MSNRRLRSWVVACQLAAGLLSVSHVAAADEGQASPDAARILATIDAKRGGWTPKDKAAARRMNADGDRAYRSRDYRAASSAYGSSYPNFPNAHAYILAGDSHWRAALKYHEDKPVKPLDGSCDEPNNGFSRAMGLDLAQHYEVGFVLAQREGDPTFLNSPLLRRAHESAACLGSMARDYQPMPIHACVDLERLRACLGEPLLK